jgi:murein DD-endopeptidase MepM/ murein hydrolase activator NlpD
LHNKGKSVFGQKKSKHVLILANDDKVRHMVIKPWILGIAVSFVAVMVIGHLLATTYLVVRDDLVGSSMARQARMQHSYEDRISQLRSELDRVTSKQLLNQQLVQDKVAELMQRQTTLSDRHGQLSPILDRAGIIDVEPQQIPIPMINPLKRAKSASLNRNVLQDHVSSNKKPKISSFDTASISAVSAFVPVQQITNSISPTQTFVKTSSDNLFGNVALSLQNIEHEQIARIQALAENTATRTAQITQILKGSKLPAPKIDADDESAIGGPFVPQSEGDTFNYSLRGLDLALRQYDQVLTHIENLPLKHPVIGSKISSKFGNRRDPFLRRYAFHAGIDFKARTGTSVKPTANGRVIKAGWQGGYGKMVVVDHGNGTTTRYAHLSRILVNHGQMVSIHTTIGKVGSTGRSTGPHLHYEIRENGKAINPLKYLNAGSKLRPILKSS